MEKLDRFVLKWYSCNEDSHETINVWIHNLVSLKPSYVHIELDFPKLENLYFLSCLFNCSTIVSLTLRRILQEAADINPIVVNLPFLKNLELSCLYMNDEFIQKRILGCPILEKLCIENCFLTVTEKISSSSLKTLRIVNNEFSEDARLQISFPGLVELESDIQLGRISFENLESLECASVTPKGMSNDYQGMVLKGLANAKSIKLFSFYINYMFKKESSDLPVFERLESLDLAYFTINKDLEPLASFLKHTPNLKSLTLRHVSMEKHRVFPQREINEIQCDSLKTVEIVCWNHDDQRAHALVKYLHLHLRNIENVTINVPMIMIPLFSP
ncbi:hypothetical protein LUZ60_005224 [Juncus effusus]|nr:hypothetical protein LUZ60_005224 [Juncus effusus]